MKVLLIEPPLSQEGASSYETPTSRVFSPPWLLMCLRAYLQQRTHHECYFTDARLYSDVETELLAAVELSEAEVAVVHVAPATTGEAAAVLDILKRNVPSLITIVCGPYPSQFVGETPDLGRADYALAGDPEPILRDLLEYHSIPRKLVRTPGLLARWMPPGRTPYWLDDLRGLSLPEWAGILWPAYASSTGQIRIAARLSRGHTRLPPDYAFGDYAEPLRLWPMERMAVAVQKTSGQRINEVFLSDPPGLWSPDRLTRWCQALISIRNTQHWSFRMLPTLITDETIELLQRSACAGIEFLYPSVTPAAMTRFGCTVSLRDMRATLAKVQAAGIRAYVRFWLAGPETASDEARHILHVLRALDYPSAAFELHPFSPDSPLAAEHPEAREKLRIWLEWLKAPWLHTRPQLAWGSGNPAITLAATVQAIQKGVQRDPRRRLKHLWAHLTKRNWIAHVETRTAAFWTAVNVARDLNDQRSK